MTSRTKTTASVPDAPRACEPPDELKVAVTSVLVAANELDDELQQRFGGLRWVDSDD